MTEEIFKVKIERPNLDRYSMAFYNCDVECRCCGRPIRNRATTYVVVNCGVDEEGLDCFKPIPQEELANDPVEWGSFVGARCAKLLPKEYKVSYKKLLKNHSHTWF